MPMLKVTWGAALERLCASNAEHQYVLKFFAATSSSTIGISIR